MQEFRTFLPVSHAQITGKDVWTEYFEFCCAIFTSGPAQKPPVVRDDSDRWWWDSASVKDE